MKADLTIQTKRGSVVITPCFEPDEFWPAERIARLADLMRHWKAARDNGETPLTDAEEAELDTLVLDQTEAAGKRAQALADAAGL